MKEAYLQTKAKYIELAKKTGFEFKANINRSRHGDSFTNDITILNGGESNKFIAKIINDNAALLVTKVKGLATAQLTDFKDTYQDSYLAYKNAVDNDTPILDATAKLLDEFKELRNSLAPISGMTTFEAEATQEGFTINGFSVFNNLLVTVLNDNLALVESKYKKEVQSEFTAYETALKKDAQELIVEINK